MKKILSVLLCLIFCLSLSACNQTDTNTTMDVSPVATFDTIESFNIALKKNPNQYMGNCISVKGYMSKVVLGSRAYAWLEDILTPKDEPRDSDSPRLNLFMADSVWLAVVGDGDYVEIRGTVAIDDGKICLKDCFGTVIIAVEEMEKTPS